MRGGIWTLDGSLRNTKRDAVYCDPSVLWSLGVIVHYLGRNAYSSHKLIMDLSFMWKEEALLAKYWIFFWSWGWWLGKARVLIATYGKVGD